MAILYPWATKEYLLWNMTIGQIMLYYRIGMDFKYPKQTDEDGEPVGKSFDQMTPAEARAKRDELRDLYGETDG